jgi:hypothetical protein
MTTVQAGKCSYGGSDQKKRKDLSLDKKEELDSAMTKGIRNVVVYYRAEGWQDGMSSL